MTARHTLVSKSRFWQTLLVILSARVIHTQVVNPAFLRWVMRFRDSVRPELEEMLV